MRPGFYVPLGDAQTTKLGPGRSVDADCQELFFPEQEVEKLEVGLAFLWCRHAYGHTRRVLQRQSLRSRRLGKQQLS